MGFQAYSPQSEVLRLLVNLCVCILLGRNMVFDLFPRTDKGKIGVFFSKNAL